MKTTLINLVNNRVVLAMYPDTDEELDEAVQQLNGLSHSEVTVHKLNNLQPIKLNNGSYVQLLLRP